MWRESVTAARRVARSFRRFVRPGLAVAGLALLPLEAAAHPGSGSSAGQQHLVTDAFGLVAFAFLAYLSASFARRVVYPRVRDALS